MYMLILLSQNEQGISAFIDLQKHILPSGSSPMKRTFPWMQRHGVTYYKGEQLVWNKPLYIYIKNTQLDCSQIIILSIYVHTLIHMSYVYP